MEKIKYLPFSRTINSSLSGYYASLKEAEAVQTNGKRWIDITPFLDYLLGIMEECIVTSIKEDNKLNALTDMGYLEKTKQAGKNIYILQ